ncbi:MAG: DUF3179 domain-containing (seleno)protein [Planctomycetota bacterium]
MRRTGSSEYRWTPGRIVAGVVIVATGAAIVGFVGRQEIAGFRDGLAADAAHASLLKRAADEQAGGFNVGFNVDNLTIPRHEIAFGGPAKDGIPSLTNPDVVSIDSADHLRDDDRVVGVSLGGHARAYPIRALIYHEAVNDEVGGVPIAVVYCPLCDSVTVVDRRLDDRIYTFGATGSTPSACRVCCTTPTSCSTTAPMTPCGRSWVSRPSAAPTPAGRFGTCPGSSRPWPNGVGTVPAPPC